MEKKKNSAVVKAEGATEPTSVKSKQNSKNPVKRTKTTVISAERMAEAQSGEREKGLEVVTRRSHKISADERKSSKQEHLNKGQAHQDDGQEGESRRGAHRGKQSSGRSGWIAAVCTLGLAVLILTGTLVYNYTYNSAGNALISSEYEKAFNELAGCVDTIDVSLSKLAATNDTALQQKLLLNVAIECEVAENDLQSLPLCDGARFTTCKMINQLGDYSKTLIYKLAEGGSLDGEDKRMLDSFYGANLNLSRAISKSKEGMGEKFSFLKMLDGKGDDVLSQSMIELENLSVGYPKMIYDGPFSDGLDRREAKGLKGSEVDGVQAEELLRALMADYIVGEITYEGESHGKIPTHDFSFEGKSGEEVYVQLTKRGGKLILFNSYAECKEEKFTLLECREIAECFAKKAGYDDLKVVWETADDGVARFNLAPAPGEVVYYPDLVKMTVCMERGVVSSIEADGYCLNHTERRLHAPSVSQNAAIEAVGDGMEVDSARLAIVPVGGGRERLSWELHGYRGEEEFYIYVDAKTGREIEIFKVTTGAGGRLVI